MKLFVTGLVSLLSVGALAQQPWQKMQMPAAAQVASVWKNTPPEYGPEPYYGFGGAMDEAAITRDLDTLKGLGFKAVTIQAGADMPYPYLSDGYFKLFRVFLNEAKKRDMRVWIVDDIGYPSGFAGGKFSELKPELRMQALVVAQKIPANGGDVVKQEVGADVVSVASLNTDTGMTVPVPVTDGTIAWTAPEGKWQVLVVEHQFKTSPTKSDTNPKRVKDASQSLEDYLDPAATMQYLEFTHEQYKRTVGDEFGKTIMGFRGDEPDYSISGVPWTPKLFERFQAVKGYDVRPYVAAFFQPKMTEEQRRAKADYWDVFSQMFRDGFFKVQGDWCAANHLEYQVHLNHEELEMQLTHSEGEFFRAMQYVQVPGIDSIWHQIYEDTISDFPRLASSVSHMYGRPRAFTESFAAYRPAPTVEQARYILNEQFVRGINLIETMYFPSTSKGVRPAPSFMGQPGYPELMQYTQRMSYLMSMGRPTANVALYLPSSSMWMGDAAADAAFVAAEQMLSERQINFDIVSEDGLARDMSAARGAFETKSGNRFTTVILPNVSLLSQEAVDRLRAFASGGGHVLFLGKTPSLIAGKTILNAKAATAADFSWASVVAGELPPTPTPPMQPPTTSLVPQVVPAGFAEAVRAAIPEMDVKLDGADTALKVMKRRLKDADVYLFFNEGAQASSHKVTLRSEGKKVEVWDPQTAEVSSLKAEGGKGAVKVELALKPYETRVLMIR